MKRLLKSLLSCFLILVFVSNGTILAKDEYQKAGFTDETLATFAEHAVVIRVGNYEYYNHNVREYFFENDKQISPFVKESEIYVPVSPVLKAFGFQVTENNGEVVATLDEAEYNLSQNIDGAGYDMRFGKLYATGSTLAALVECQYYSNDSVAVIYSDNVGTEITDSIAREFGTYLDYTWDNMYLGSLGYVTGMISHPNNNELIYARTDVGGMYRFDYSTERWIQLLDVLTYEDRTLIGVRSMAIDPNDDNIIYAACGMNTTSSVADVLKSTDRGESWKRLHLDKKFGANDGTIRLTGEAIIVDPNNSNIIYCGTSLDGLFVSEDGGGTWKSIDSVPKTGKVSGGISFTYVDSRKKTSDGRSSDVYVGAFGTGVYKSSDGGKTFELMNGSPAMPNKMEMVKDRIYVSGTDSSSANIKGGFFCFENGQWKDITPDENGRFSTDGFIIDKTNPDKILINCAPYKSNNFYRSYNGGLNWEYMGSFKDAAELLQDPKNPSGFWLPYGAGILFQEDMDAEKYNFKSRDSGIEELVTSKMISIPHPDAPLVLVQCMDHGMKVQERPDQLVHASKPNFNQGAGVDFCEADPSYVMRTGLIGGTDNSTGTVAISNDYGRTFTSVNWKSSNRIMDSAVGATKQANGYPILMVMSVGDQNGGNGRGVYRSKDNGATWEKMDIPVERSNAWYYNNRIIASDRVNGKTFYYTENASLYVTKDGGDTWTVAYRFPQNDWDFMKSVPGVEGGVWYYSSGAKKLYATYDFGKSWAEVPGVGRVSAGGIGFGIGKDKPDIPAAYIAGYVNDIYGIYMTDDLGESWRRINTDSQNFPATTVDVCGDRLEYGRVFVSTGGRGAFYGQPVWMDDIAPVITMRTTSSVDDMNSPEYAVNQKTFTVTGSVDEYCEVRINGQTVALDGYNIFSKAVELSEGENEFLIEAKDDNGNFSEAQKLMIRYVPDFLGIEFETLSTIVTKNYSVKIIGRTAVPTTIYSNGKVVTTGEGNYFELEHTIEGSCQIPVYAIDGAGVVSATTVFNVVYDTSAPEITFESDLTRTTRGLYTIKGKLNEKGEVMVNGKIVQTDENFAFSIPVSLELNNNDVRIQARDVAKNATKPQTYDIYREKIDTSVLTAIQKSENLAIDGDVSEWNFSNFADKVFYGTTNNDVAFGAMWDNEYLYIGVNVVDNIIYTSNSSMYDNDAVEIYIDGNNSKAGGYDSKCKQFAYVPDELFHEASYMYKLTPNGYSVEIKIPWSTFSMQPKAGMKIGFDIDIVDNDGTELNHGRDGAIGYNGTSDNWRNTTGFATMTLE